ncbi:MAG TPA: DUF1800 domain-containing protein [Pyrinomonadaceae bacterium]|nr:DUF1800 domain-containing protein [Pyrinomonadaceae bacterium]
MNARKNSSDHAKARGMRRALALVSIFSLLAGTFLAGASAQQRARQNRLGEDQRMLHVLNRAGFGARPGDVERVRALGLDRYIEQQLHPETLSDAVAEAKVQNLDALKMTTAELYEKFPQPGRLFKQMERQGKLSPELAALRENKGKGAAEAGAQSPGMASKEGDASAAMMTADGASKTNAAAAPSKVDDNGQAAGKNKEYRQAVRDYYLQNDLRLPQQMVAQLQASRILRAVYSERQLQEAMVDFWTNHFNVFADKGADKWLLVSYDRDTIRPNAMGKFYDLLLATAQSPAMLFYLDNFQSVSPNAQSGMGRNRGLQGGSQQQRPFLDMMMRRRGIAGPDIRPNAGGAGANMPQQAQAQTPQPKRAKRGINENYARELMELHTLGVDGGYTQKDVQEVARCFTGWTIFAPRGAGGGGGGKMEDAGKFYFNPRLHDEGEKLVLGHKIPAGGGLKDGLMVLDILAHHPATAKHLAFQLSQRFVSDNPSPALVERVANAYTKSGGDVRETLRAIFTSPEFNAPEAYRAKIKQPFELTVSAIRALGGETNGGPALQQWVSRMGQPLYGYQTPNGYADMAEAWVNTGALLERLNFCLALAGNRINGTRVDLSRFAAGASLSGPINSSTLADQSRILDRFINVILQGEVSQGTRETLLKQLAQQTTAPPNTTEMDKTDKTDKVDGTRVGPRAARREMARNDAASGNPEVTRIVGLILGSPEFQRQ